MKIIDKLNVVGFVELMRHLLKIDGTTGKLKQ